MTTIQNTSDIVDGWNKYQAGRMIWLFRQKTMNGSAQTDSISFPVPFVLHRISFNWDDTTAKDFEVRIYSYPSNTNLYTVLDVDTANTATNRQKTWGDKEMVFPGGSMIWLQTTGTNAKIGNILINIEELSI